MSCNTITITQNCCPCKCGHPNGDSSNEGGRFEQLSLAISQDLTDNVSTKDYQAIPFNTDTGLTLTNAVVENGYVRNMITGGIGTSSWNQDAGALPMDTSSLFSSIVIDNTVYIVGGYDFKNGFTQVYKKSVTDFVAGTGSWTTNGSLPGTFEGAFSTIIIGDNVYILGGYNWTNKIAASNVYRKSVTDFIAGTGSWVASGDLPTTTAFGLSTIVLNDTVYILGGTTSTTGTCYSQVYQKSVVDFIAGTGTWTVNGSLPIAKSVALSTISIGDTIYILGGVINHDPTAYYTEIYQKPTLDFIAGTGSWTANGSLPSSAFSSLSSIVIDDYLYILAGSSLGGSVVKSLQLANTEPMSVTMPTFAISQSAGTARIYFMAEDEDKAISETISNDQIKLNVSIDNGSTFKRLTLIVRDDLDDYAISGTKWIASEDFDLTDQTGIIAKILTQAGNTGKIPNVKIYHFNDFVLSKQA